MQFKSLFVILAAGLSVAMAGEEKDTTVTSTSTQTRTLTITECEPSNTACPGYWTKNSTVSAHPTYSKNSTDWAYPTGGKVTETKPIATSPAKTTAPIPTAGAGGLFVQSGLLLGVLGAGIALVA